MRLSKNLTLTLLLGLSLGAVTVAYSQSSSPSSTPSGSPTPSSPPATKDEPDPNGLCDRRMQGRALVGCVNVNCGTGCGEDGGSNAGDVGKPGVDPTSGAKSCGCRKPPPDTKPTQVPSTTPSQTNNPPPKDPPPNNPPPPSNECKKKGDYWEVPSDCKSRRCRRDRGDDKLYCEDNGCTLNSVKGSKPTCTGECKLESGDDGACKLSDIADKKEDYIFNTKDLNPLNGNKGPNFCYCGTRRKGSTASNSGVPNRSVARPASGSNSGKGTRFTAKE